MSSVLVSFCALLPLSFLFFFFSVFSFPLLFLLPTFHLKLTTEN